ncbi:hypothetical protein UlMin_038795 [Ulmus minor]
MDKVYEELEEAKDEIEKLKAECKRKAELSESLKKANNEQIAKFQEASLKIEKQAQEIDEKAEEISSVKQTFEDLRCCLTEKESIVKHLSAANDKLRVDLDEKFRKWEEEKQGLVLALEEANEKNFDQEQLICACKEEIEGLKGSLSALQKKCLEAEKRASGTKDSREHVLLSLEEESKKLEDQLKWKKEQFKHLEEAHEKMREQFKKSKKEWELEKSSLLEEISSLQTSLDSQTRISEDLQNRLQMCNQALAHEESRRRHVEAQLSEVQAKFENAFSEYQDEKSQLVFLTEQRDNEIASLRHTLGKKEAYNKELEYQTRKLEQDNQELMISVKELQEAQIREAPGSPSMAKLRSKLRYVEQMHKESAANLRAKEAELSSQLETVTQELVFCKSQLKSKDVTIQELRMEIEQMHEDSSAILRTTETGISQLEEVTRNLNNYRSELESKDAIIEELRKTLDQIRGDLNDNFKAKENEWKFQLEMMTMDQTEWKLQLEMMTIDLNKLQSELDSKDETIEDLKMELEDSRSLSLQLKLQNDEISEAQLKIANEKAEMDRIKKEKEQDMFFLKEQLEMKNAAIDRFKKDIEKEREKTATLLKRIESWDVVGQQQLLMQKEIERYEEMLMESSMCELFLKEHISKMEGVLKKKLTEVCDDLDRTNAELAEKICEGNEIEFELHIWKSIAERLKFDLEESYVMRKELEASLLAQVDVGETIKQEKANLCCELEEKDKKVKSLQHQIGLLQKKLKTREAVDDSAEVETAVLFESEKAKFLQIIREKDEILEQIQKEVEWLEQESLRREIEGFLLAKIGAERTIELEKEKLVQNVVEQKSQRVDHLMQLVKTLEDKFNSSLVTFSSQLAEKQAEINLVQEAWEKITAAEIMASLEIEEKKLMIVELEDDIRTVQQKLELQQKSMCVIKQQALEVEAKLEAKELEMRELSNQMKTKLKSSDALIEDLKSEKSNLLEDVTKLSTERENLLGFIGGVDDRISEFSSTDKQLMDMLEKIMLSCDNHSLGMDLNLEEEQSGGPVRKSVHSPTTLKKFESISDARSPFREINT